MERLRIGFIGTGLKPVKKGPLGYGMAHEHAAAYKALPAECELVACADIVPERARLFAEQYDIPRFYGGHQEMLAKEQLDLVSICTWPDQHELLVVATAQAGVRAIHCEKPMADTWAASFRMAEVCRQAGCKLTFDHQRRFGQPFRKAKALIDAGEIGELQRIEFGAGNLYDYGSHNFDMANYFNNEESADWVIAQIDYRDENLVFDMHNENQAYAQWHYRNGVFGVASTGQGSEYVGCHHRVVGSAGVIELGKTGPNMPALRIRRQGSLDWEAIDCGKETMHGPDYIKRAIADVMRAARGDGESELCARNALNATEQIFACWESSRRRARVDLPLPVALGNPLVEMVKAGDLLAGH